ncbi:uncharacterized protein [Pocillopora verrucosa]|uniref:uncharacterized protein n=1 Tax=Pocillopora verrucosa TaxID=203993 RepID=UPI00333E8C63
MTMSRNGSDVYLSYSAGKNGQPAENGSRARKPNTSLDQEGISLERIRELRKRRGGVLSSLTSKRREIDSLLTDENNLETVKVKLSEITSLFRRFTEAHDAYNVALVEESQRQESDLYFADIESSLDFFCRTVNDWLRVTEARLQDNLLTPDDSASQIGSEVRSKSRPSMCGSRTSHFSKTSSISAARAKEAARIAELRAEAHALKHRYSLQESELRLKRQEYDLQLKKDELNLKTEYAKAVAREEAYAQAEAGNFAPSNVASRNPRCPVSVVSSITEKSRTGGSKRESFVPADKKEKLSVKSSNPVKDHKGAVSDSSSSSGNSGLSDQAYGILVQQNRVMEEFVKQQQRNLLPRRRVPVFSGDPLHYCAFIRAFETVIETRELDYAGRLYYLEQHTAGRAQELVQSCLYMKAEDGYVKAKKLLESKFGQKHKIAMAYVDKVTNGPVIKAEDADALEGFAVLLSSCTNTLKAIGHSSKFESPDSMRKIIERLPRSCKPKARTLSNPVFGKLPCLEKEKKNSKDRGSRSKSERPGGKQLSLVTISETKSALNSSADVLSAVHSSKKNCLFCNADHNLTECSSFAKVPPTDRQEFVMKQRLCFSCLGGGHQSRSCHKRKPCIHCNKRHATVMHVGAPEAIVASDRGKDGPQSENNQSSTEKNRADHFCGLTTMEGSVTALPIVAVKVKVKGSPRSVETYALLDNGSNTTFCSANLLRRLRVCGKEMRLKLTTMDSCNDVDSLVVTNLEVADLDENVVISLPEVLSRPSMPVVKDEIPKQEDVERWPHLQGYVYLAELNSEVDLLIGANVPEALQPREVVPASDGGPYATRVDLGWVINGPTGRKQKFVPSSSFFVNCKETHPMCIACADFADATLSDGLSMSRDDLKFMNIVEDSVMQCEDGHYQVSLPLRDLNLQMPANRSQAERRALYLKRKFSKDVKFREDYVACLGKVIGDGFAEKVPLDVLERSDGKVWFIPHHGVYHHKKPDKIRVVFDCSAHSQGTSLNDELFQGPDLTNNLVGVLIRFRQEPVAVMGDVQSMFHQVRVPEEDRDLLRFLWWPRGDFSKELEEYRMTVHLFGAVSSPSCANFAMRRNAEDHRHEFSPDVVSTVLKNFYVDDCLKSLPSATVAIKHVEELRRLMLRGGFNLTKWISNDREVLESIPVEARAKGVKDLDLDNDVLPAERALGVSWFVETDTFGFKVNIKEKPCTRRGILSVVSSVYDPLGMAAPFILPAKLLLQDLCRKSLGWDDEIPSDYLSRWRVWLNGLPKSFVVHVSKDSSIVSIIQRFSSWFKLLKFIALCLRCQRRFVMRRKVSKENCLDTADASGAKLVTNAELEEAGKEIIKFEQNLTFAEELEAVKGGKCVKGSSALARLDPILTDGLLRVGGRLSRATLSDDSKHQIIIPKDSHLARLLVNHFHQKSGHSGREYVLALLRDCFWLIRANSTVRSVLSSCFDCKRRQGPVGEQKMANLPRPRVTPDQPPFTCVGIDYFGPFLVRQKRSMVKRYGAIFTCLALRAVHLEVCHSLDTDSFIHALRRFIARRGQVKEIRSDNGSNFVGGERELRVMIDSWNQAKIHDALLQKSIKWVFNPPGASRHGGVWERLIRSTRKVLGALVKEQSLDDESLQTLLCECESIINGRPLTTVSDDPKDLEPLSPNHLLLLRSETPLPPGLFFKSDTYSRRRWRQVQYLADVFWGRWKREYLPLLQSRQKWFRPKKNFAVGDTVIVVDENLPRNAWAIGRITEVFPDKYGFVRRVKVKTKTSTLERPISKLCLLESIEQVEGKIH